MPKRSKFFLFSLPSRSNPDQADCGIRDYGKKVHAFEMELETTIDKLNKATEEFEEKNLIHAEVDKNHHLLQFVRKLK